MAKQEYKDINEIKANLIDIYDNPSKEDVWEAVEIMKGAKCTSPEQQKILTEAANELILAYPYDEPKSSLLKRALSGATIGLCVGVALVLL